MHGPVRRHFAVGELRDSATRRVRMNHWLKPDKDPEWGSGGSTGDLVGRSPFPNCPSQCASAVVAPVVRWIAIRWHPNVLQAGTRTDPRLGRGRHLLFPLGHDSTDSLARSDPSDVGSLSCQVMLQPVSGPLPSGLRFFRHPKPAPPKTDLAVCCPRRERYGVSTFRLSSNVGVGAC